MSEVNEENGYNLKDSTKLVGQLYPILKAADGEILDGSQRAASDPSWKVQVLANIDTPEKKLAAQLIANIARRTVQKQEKEKWINDLAELYLKQGLKVEAKRTDGKPGQGSNEIKDRIVEITGLCNRTVTNYLRDCFKQMNFSRDINHRNTEHEAPAAEVIRNILNSHSSGSNKGYGERLLERHEKELIKSPVFRAQVIASLPATKRNFSLERMEVTRGVMAPREKDLPEGVYQGADGILYKKQMPERHSYSRGKPPHKLPKGEGMPKKDQEPELHQDSFYEMFQKDCPDCLCAGCAHANECSERVLPDEQIRVSVLRASNHGFQSSNLMKV